MRVPCLFAAVVLSALSLQASDLRGVSPVTDTIVMVHFNEGHIDQGLNEQTAKPYIAKLDTKAAAVAANYSIISEDDARFKTEQHPLKVGRKAKAADTLSMFTPQKFVLDHFIYLVLPQSLQRGCTYTVRVTGLASAPQTYTFLFNEYSLRSETLHVS